MSKSIVVIMPTFGNTDFIEEALRSVCTQHINGSLYNLQVLLGIDNCLDSLTFVKNMLPTYKNINAYFFTEHLGPYIIRNTLVKNCDADYIIFFDSDDVMPPGFIAHVATLLDRHEMVLFYRENFVDIPSETVGYKRTLDLNEIDIYKNSLLTEIDTVNSKVLATKKLAELIRSRRIFKKQLYVNFINRIFNKTLNIPGVFAVRRGVFMNLNGYKNWPLEADSEFRLRAELNGINQTYISKKLAFLRRIHSQSLTTNRSTGEGSQFRNMYNGRIAAAIHENEPMAYTDKFYLLDFKN